MWYQYPGLWEVWIVFEWIMSGWTMLPNLSVALISQCKEMQHHLH